MSMRPYQKPNTQRSSPFPGAPSRSWVEAIQELPHQYMNVLMRPSAGTFAREMGKASWSMVWVQLIAYLALSAGFDFLTAQIPSLRSISNSGMSIPMNVLVFTLPGFVLSMALYYMLARALKGNGTLLAQSYVILLLSVPITLLSLVGPILGIIPFIGIPLVFLWVFGWSIYALVLQVYALMAVHHLSGGKATGVILISIFIAIIFIAIIVIVAFIIFATVKHLP